VAVPKALREAVLQSAHGRGGDWTLCGSQNHSAASIRDFTGGSTWRTFAGAVTTAQQKRAIQLQQFPVGGECSWATPHHRQWKPPGTHGHGLFHQIVWDQEAETIVDSLTAGIFCRFGAAESIHSDQGRNFESRVFATMCERLGMQKTRTPPLHPQSDRVNSH
jgi:hypothetical protein